jgi:hypothetical protein
MSSPSHAVLLQERLLQERSLQERLLHEGPSYAGSSYAGLLHVMQAPLAMSERAGGQARG